MIILDILMWIALASVGIMFLLGAIAIIREAKEKRDEKRR